MKYEIPEDSTRKQAAAIAAYNKRFDQSPTEPTTKPKPPRKERQKKPVFATRLSKTILQRNRMIKILGHWKDEHPLHHPVHRACTSAAFDLIALNSKEVGTRRLKDESSAFVPLDGQKFKTAKGGTTVFVFGRSWLSNGKVVRVEYRRLYTPPSEDDNFISVDALNKLINSGGLKFL